MKASFGLVNTGNNCYMNSLIQALISIRDFMVNIDNMKGNWPDLFKNTIRKKNSSEIVNEISKYSTLQIGNQECAHETFIKLVELIGLESIFEMYYKRFVCCNCGSRPIEKEKVLYFLSSQDFNEENLSTWGSTVEPECSECNSNAKLVNILMETQNIIVVALNKFRRKRILEFPIQLELQGEEKRLIYNLVAQVEHSGSMSGGHYTAICKRGENTYLFNDSSVSFSSLAPTPNSFLLFYCLN